jgi:uncharacterized protein (DUF1697 family)
VEWRLINKTGINQPSRWFEPSIMQPMALVIFLRGVNVGGHRTFRPNVLANEFKDYGVVNIGAPGTFVFRKRVSQALLRSELLRCLPFKTAVMTCTGQELIAAASDDPFAGEPDRPTPFVS